jgi:hypothetical protein
MQGGLLFLMSFIAVAFYGEECGLLREWLAPSSNP